MASRKNNRRTRQRAQVARGSKSRRTGNRRNKAGLWQTIKTANSRAQQRSNERVWRRKGLTSVKAALSDGVIDDYQLGSAKLILRTLIGILLLFPCYISTVALFNISSTATSGINTFAELRAHTPFWFFGIGVFLMLGWFYSSLFKGFFLYLYVLGHELTHAFFIYLCGGKVSEFKVTKEGGFVVTNKSNILISLSPYFVPFWSVLILGTFLLLDIFVNIPFHEQALYLLLGASWTFHLAWTIWMIPRDQPDLKENGSFFSLTIIYLANVLLLAVILCMASTSGSFTQFLYHWYNLFDEKLTHILAWLKSFL